jgi:hypothetical protein
MSPPRKRTCKGIDAEKPANSIENGVGVLEKLTEKKVALLGAHAEFDLQAFLKEKCQSLAELYSSSAEAKIWGVASAALNKVRQLSGRVFEANMTANLA